MSLAQPCLRQLDAYPFLTEISARYGDQDPQAHVNNVAIASIYEDARARFLYWLADQALQPLDPPGRMIASLRIDYLAQLYYPGTFQIGVGIGAIGRTSYRMLLGIFQQGDCAGLCETVVVHSDRQNSREISQAWRESLSAGLLRSC